MVTLTRPDTPGEMPWEIPTYAQGHPSLGGSLLEAFSLVWGVSGVGRARVTLLVPFSTLSFRELL